ncbi:MULTISPECIES: hypothetical protein [unclassified Bifidobacterium]|nr:MULTISPECIES: hypothetical protein [unclassified Bifidobacterium]
MNRLLKVAVCVLTVVLVSDEMLALQHEYGKTLIVVTHDTGIAAQCDRVLELHHAA